MDITLDKLVVLGTAEEIQNGFMILYSRMERRFPPVGAPAPMSNRFRIEDSFEIGVGANRENVNVLQLEVERKLSLDFYTANIHFDWATRYATQFKTIQDSGIETMSEEDLRDIVLECKSMALDYGITAISQYEAIALKAMFDIDLIKAKMARTFITETLDVRVPL